MAYRKASQSGDPGARAAAFLGLARVLRRLGNYDAAVEAYDDLAALGDVRVAGQPAALVGRQGRCKVFEERRDTRSLTGAAADLAAVLYSGRWPIDRSTFLLYREMLERWGVPPLPADSLARTESATELWHLWRRGDLPYRGRRLLQREHAPVLALWAGSGESAIASLSTASDLEQALQPLASAQGLALGVTGTDGAAVFGDTRTGISLTPDETRLPFIMRAAPHSTNAEPQESVRRAVIISALSLALCADAGRGFRTVSGDDARAAAGAAAVGFRVGGLARVSDAADVDAPSDGSAGVAQHHAAKSARRSITSCWRTKPSGCIAWWKACSASAASRRGAYAWQLEPADAANWFMASSRNSAASRSPQDREVVCDVEEGLPPIRADREALSRALWNLLENAGEVLGGGHADSRLRAAARRHGSARALGIAGAGIPRTSSEKIFQKFVRGADAKRAGVRGVGIGLALVKRIVEAHGGIGAGRKRARPRQHVHAGPSMSRILIVEDDAAIGVALEDDLRLEGYAVELVARRRGRASRAARDGGVRPDPARRDAAEERRLRRVPRAAPLGHRVDDPAADGAHGETDKCSASISAPTTTSPSRTARRSCERGSARCCGAAAADRAADEIIRFGDCELDFGRGELRRAGKPVPTTPLEFKLLGLFTRRAGRVLTRRVLIDEAWGKDTAITERVVDNQIANLRRKIEPSPSIAAVPEERQGHRISIRPRRRDRIVTPRGAIANAGW